MVVEVAPLGLPMHRRRVQASGGETMKPLLRPFFTAMGSVMITGSIGQRQWNHWLYAWVNLELDMACYAAATAVAYGDTRELVRVFTPE